MNQMRNREKKTKKDSSDPTQKGIAQHSIVHGNYEALLNQLAIVEEKLNSIEKKFCEEIDSSMTPPVLSARVLNQIQDPTGKDLLISGLVNRLARSISSLNNSVKQKTLTKDMATGSCKSNDGGNITVETLQVYPAQLEPERTGQMYWPRRPKSWKTAAPPKPSPNQRLLRSRSPPPSPHMPLLVDRGTQTTTDSSRLPLCFLCKQKLFYITPENPLNHDGDFRDALTGKLQSIGCQNGVLIKRPNEPKRNAQSKYTSERAQNKYISERLDKLVEELTAPKEYLMVQGDVQTTENRQKDLDEGNWKAELAESFQVFNKLRKPEEEKENRQAAKYVVKSKVGLRSTPTKIKFKSRRFYYPKSSSEVKRKAEKLAMSLVQRLVKKRDFHHEGYKAFPTSIVYKNSTISCSRGSTSVAQGNHSRRRCSNECDSSSSCSTCTSSTSSSGTLNLRV